MSITVTPSTSRGFHARHLERAASFRRQAHWLGGDLRRQAMREHGAAMLAAKGERSYWRRTGSVAYQLPG